MAMKQPSHLTHLLAYSSLIVQTFHKYTNDNWQVYDRNFSLQAAANQWSSWSHIDSSLWTMAFANAVTDQHGQWCLSLDHMASKCPDSLVETSVPVCWHWNWLDAPSPFVGAATYVVDCLSLDHKEQWCLLGWMLLGYLYRLTAPVSPKGVPKWWMILVKWLEYSAGWIDSHSLANPGHSSWSMTSVFRWITCNTLTKQVQSPPLLLLNSSIVCRSSITTPTFHKPQIATLYYASKVNQGYWSQ